MAIQLDNAGYASYQSFSTKKVVDAKDGAPADKPHRISWLTYKIGIVAGKETIIADKTGYTPKSGTSEADLKAEMAGHPETFKQFFTALTESKEPRFGLIDVFKTFADGHHEQRQAVIRFSPDTCGVKAKMTYSQAEGNFKGKIGASKVVQANGTDELTIPNIVEKTWTK